MDYQNQSRDRTAEILCSAVATPSVELQARSARLARSRSPGAKTHAAHSEALEALHQRELTVAQRVFAWMTDNGWTGGIAPDFEAILSED